MEARITKEYFRTFQGANKISKKLKVPIKKVRQVLGKLEAYQRTKQIKAKTRRKYMHKIVAYPRKDGRDDAYQSDLLDISPTAYLQRMNGGTRYLALIIDVYSRFLWIYALKKKTTAELMRTIGKHLEKKRPKNLTFDRESGIRSKIFTEHLQKLDIRLYHPEKQPNDFKGSTAIVERANRTIRTLITRYRVANKTEKWFKHLDQITKSYNESAHRSLKYRTPAEVYKDQNSLENQVRKVFEFATGSWVRIRVHRKNIFEKKSLPQWSREIYIIVRKVGKKYELKNRDTNEIRKGKIAPQDLQIIPESTYSVRRSERKKEPAPPKKIKKTAGIEAKNIITTKRVRKKRIKI